VVHIYQHGSTEGFVWLSNEFSWEMRLCVVFPSCNLHISLKETSILVAQLPCSSLEVSLSYYSLIVHIYNAIVELLLLLLR